MIKKIIKIIIINIFFILPLNAEELRIFDFTENELGTLKVRKVRGADNTTSYSIGNNENGNYLKANAKNSASGLGKEIKIDLNSTPYINITWKVEKDLKGIKEKTKKGHDFAGRVFVIKKTGATPLSNRAVNYVFSSNQNVGESWLRLLHPPKRGRSKRNQLFSTFFDWFLLITILQQMHL